MHRRVCVSGRSFEGNSAKAPDVVLMDIKLPRNVRDRLRRETEANVAIATNHYGDNIRGQ